MTTQAVAALLLAGAVAAVPGPELVRARLRNLLTSVPDPSRPRGERWLPWLAGVASAALVAVLLGGPLGALTGGVLVAPAALVCRRWLRRPARQGGREASDPLRLAAGWDVLAACLAAGLPVPVAIRVATAELPAAPAQVLRRVAESLALGADPVTAWAPAVRDPALAGLARIARRSARSGSALAAGVTALAADARAVAHEGAEARAQRAAVLVTGPLGLCFLPAFLCLGVVPVVVGLAGQVLQTW
ncbi:MAG TPA: type II secretion system F family protein [Pseudonocardiaceae bacterium]